MSTTHDCVHHDGYLLNMRVFDEASDDMRLAPRDAWQAFRRDLIDECVDTVQAAANMLAAVEATQGEVDAAIERMDERNGNGGRL